MGMSGVAHGPRQTAQIHESVTEPLSKTKEQPTLRY